MGKRSSVNPRTFFCQICRKKLAVGSKYNHMQTHTDSPHLNFACGRKDCLKTCSTKSQLHSHEKACWRGSPLAAVHSKKPTKARTTEPKSYCRECKKTFATRKLLLRHRRDRHPGPAKEQHDRPGRITRKTSSSFWTTLCERNTTERDWLRVKQTSRKGRGVFARKPLLPKQIICEYVGELINANELASRKQDAAYDTSYLFEFKHNSTRPIAIDALQENGTLGRLINHTRIGQPNCRPVKIIDNIQKPHIAFEATQIIHIDDELLYDYEDRECIVDWMWNSWIFLSFAYAFRYTSFVPPLPFDLHELSLNLHLLSSDALLVYICTLRFLCLLIWGVVVLLSLLMKSIGRR